MRNEDNSSIACACVMEFSVPLGCENILSLQLMHQKQRASFKIRWMKVVRKVVGNIFSDKGFGPCWE